MMMMMMMMMETLQVDACFRCLFLFIIFSIQLLNGSKKTAYLILIISHELFGQNIQHLLYPVLSFIGNISFGAIFIPHHLLLSSVVGNDHCSSQMT